MQRVTIPPCSGDLIEVHPGDLLTIIDDEGGQVVDFFAESVVDPEEIQSSGVTIDCNESLRLSVGHTLYSDRYRPMFDVAGGEGADVSGTRRTRAELILIAPPHISTTKPIEHYSLL